MQKTSIHPSIVQDLLESATNAADKGQAQFETPQAFAAQCARLLPAHRPVIVDLNCANGNLLAGATLKSTLHLLGADIDPCRLGPHPEYAGQRLKIPGDLTLLYPLLCDVSCQLDLAVLNPPWDLHWHRDRLLSLSESDCPAVADAFEGRDTRLGQDQIDSTIATILIALDRMTLRGEGFAICNEATVQRLIFGEGAPHSALAKHIWLHVVVEGNPMTRLSLGDGGQPDEPFQTAVLYFARDHEDGPQHRTADVFDEPTVRRFRTGATVHEDWTSNKETPHKWKAVAEEWKARREATGSGVGLPAIASSRSHFNLWLSPDGTIGTHLNTFQEGSRKTDKKLVKELFELAGKRPMQLVIQRASRESLFRAAGVRTAAILAAAATQPGNPWRVDPALLAAVESAWAEYQGERAPMVPLPRVQRLGYLDEEDSILCLQNWRTFIAGRRYPIRSLTVTVTRRATKPNLAGETEELTFSGQELVLFIKDEAEHAFIDARALAPGVELPNLFAQSKTASNGSPPPSVEGDLPAEGLAKAGRTHPLQTLLDHFEVPEVPDVAVLQPERYLENKRRLQELEKLLP